MKQETKQIQKKQKTKRKITIELRKLIILK